MSSVTIIGVAGRRKVGKDTFVGAISQELPCSVAVHSKRFAGPLKRACKELWDLSDEQIDGSLKETVDPRWGVTPRQIMQHMGTEHGRHLFPDVHIKRLQFEIAKVKVPAFVLVTDLRFRNEFDALVQMGARTVLLEREGFVYGEGETHPSETDLLPYLDRFDFKVRNDEGKDAWNKFARLILEGLGVYQEITKQMNIEEYIRENSEAS